MPRAEGVKTAEKAVVDAKAALAEADAIEARKDNPVSIFISRKTGRLKAKLGFEEPVIDVPVKIAEPDKPLGTHVLTATALPTARRTCAGRVVTLARPLHAEKDSAPRAGTMTGRRRHRRRRGRRCRERARAHRDPAGDARAARRAHEARLLLHHLRLRPEPRDEQAHGVRRRALAQRQRTGVEYEGGRRD